MRPFNQNGLLFKKAINGTILKRDPILDGEQCKYEFQDFDWKLAEDAQDVINRRQVISVANGAR